jgi:hypothetical protein
MPGLVDQELFSILNHLERKTLLSETKIFRRDESVQEDVYPLADRVWHGNHSINGGFAVEAAHEVGQIIQYGQIVLNSDDVVVMCEERTDDLGCLKALSDIEVTRWLVEHIPGGSISRI